MMRYSLAGFGVAVVVHGLVGMAGYRLAQSPGGTGQGATVSIPLAAFPAAPPVANPPSKPPMMTLLKQARAFGVGLVLATQNPVDLDYKALSNCGTWLLGRLQIERDRARGVDGLESAAGGGAAAPGRAGAEGDCHVGWTRPIFHEVGPGSSRFFHRRSVWLLPGIRR